MQQPSHKTTSLNFIGFTLFLLAILFLGTGYILNALFMGISASLITPFTFNLINNNLDKKLYSNYLRQILSVATLLIAIFIPVLYTENTNESIQKSSTETLQELEPVEEIEYETKSSDLQQINEAADSYANSQKAKVISISDGDTIRVEIDNEVKTVRLIGIDTPETNHQNEPIQCYGPEATTAITDLILDKEVILQTDESDTDKYDRLLRYVWLEDTLLNEYMTKNGFAFSSRYPPDVLYQDRISAGENYAKQNLLGLWSKETCDGNVYTGTYKDPNKVIETQETVTTTPVIPEVPIVPTNPTRPVSPAATSNTTETNSSNYTCNCSKTCGKMNSCEEAYYQLNTCGCGARDGDDDGVPCESLCN